MKIKKFICKRCGSPKVTKIETSYVVCDYCAMLMDVDLTTGHKEYYSDVEKVKRYEQNKVNLEQMAQQALEEGNRNAFYNYKYQYWEMYLDTYPEYIIPSVNPSLLKKWIEVSALSDVYFSFKQLSQEETEAIAAQQNNYQIEFYEIDDNRYATWESFMNATKSYYNQLKHNLADMRAVPELAFINEVLPLDIALKKEMSMYAQMWLPYLEEEYHTTFLKYIKLNTEYIDLPPVKIEEKSCSNCNDTIEVPEGAIRSKCSKCNTDNTWSDVTCLNCGGKNELPSDWQETISCAYCTSEIRVINKLFE